MAAQKSSEAVEEFGSAEEAAEDDLCKPPKSEIKGYTVDYMM